MPPLFCTHRFHPRDLVFSVPGSEYERIVATANLEAARLRVQLIVTVHAKYTFKINHSLGRVLAFAFEVSLLQ